MTDLELQKKAVEVRKGVVTGVHAAKAGHPGGSLSAADVFTYLYFEEMNIDPKNPKWEDRDRFVLSKGHVAPGLYATLAEREICIIKRTYGSGFIFRAGKQGIFPGRGFKDAAPYRLPFAGASVRAAHAGH